MGPLELLQQFHPSRINQLEQRRLLLLEHRRAPGENMFEALYLRSHVLLSLLSGPEVTSERPLKHHRSIIPHEERVPAQLSLGALGNAKGMQPLQDGPARMQVPCASLAGARIALEQEAEHAPVVLGDVRHQPRRQAWFVRLDGLMGAGVGLDALEMARHPVRHANDLLTVRWDPWRRGDDDCICVVHALEVSWLVKAELLPVRVDHGGPARVTRVFLAVLLVDDRLAKYRLDTAHAQAVEGSPGVSLGRNELQLAVIFVGACLGWGEPADDPVASRDFVESQDVASASLSIEPGEDLARIRGG